MASSEINNNSNNNNQENVRWTKRARIFVEGCVKKIVNVVDSRAKEGKKLAEEDPRRIVHSFKVGLAIISVSIFYYFDFFVDGFGVNAMWAVMTVVLVFEFSVGATLGRGVNRAFATLLGGVLAVTVHRFATLTGDSTAESVVLGLSVFFIPGIATFVRFYPKVKARYDYACLIFNLTFCLITVSAYREDEILDMAHRRMSTILIGGVATVLICIFVFPIWAGEDLHNFTAHNIEKLGVFLEGFGHKYFEKPNDKNLEIKKESLDDLIMILNSKVNEESLVNFARWEPRHGRFKYWQPWDLYLKIGSDTRQCAYRIDALNCFLNSDVERPVEIPRKMQKSFTEMSSECSQAQRELALAIKTMTRSLTVDYHIGRAKNAAKSLPLLLQTELGPDSDVLDVIGASTVASLLGAIVTCTVKIADSVEELASVCKFMDPEKIMKEVEDRRGVMSNGSIEGSQAAIRVVIDH